MATPSRRTLVWSGRVKAAEPREETRDEGSNREARRRILDRYAARDRHGRVRFCNPSRDELADVTFPRLVRGNTGKVIYPTISAAQGAARQFEAIGAGRQCAYVCPLSKSGHAHLTRMD